MGLPEGTAVEIKDDGNGGINVEADTNGDGKPDTKVSEETKEEEIEEEEPSQDELDAYLRGDDLKEDKQE